MSTHAPDISDETEHVLGADGEFHVTDEPIDLSQYHFEDWIAFGFFWALASTSSSPAMRSTTRRPGPRKSRATC